MASPESYYGLAPFTYPTAPKPLETYYRVFGDLKSSITPLVIIHGGPGLSHDYLLNHSLLTTQHSIPILLYDQIGSGLSTHLPETASWPSFWTDQIFFAQLTQLLQFLGLDARDGGYDILGSSWGGMMGSRFASLRPKGLRRVVLANAPVSKRLSTANKLTYRAALPKETQNTMQAHEEAGTTSSPEYSAIMTAYIRQHICKVFPFPEDLVASIRASQEDRTVIHAMGDEGQWGGDEKGYMASWDTTEDVKKIDVPVLVINGVEESGSGEAVGGFVEGIRDVTLVTLEGTTHSPHLEDTEGYMAVVKGFLLA